jgi:hypothetical protein
MGAAGEEGLEVLFCLGDGIGPRHADDAEAASARMFNQRRLEFCRIVQKSRST